MGFQVAIDGPAASGKSTVARLLAERLGFEHVNSGAIYRAVAVFLHDSGLTPNSPTDVLGEVLSSLKIDYSNGRVFVNGEDYSERIQTPQAGLLASDFAKLKVVREHLVRVQREICDEKNVVVDGRDIGTVVLPNAHLKIFLTASLEERVERKLRDYLRKGINVDRETVRRELVERDEQDSARSVAPLRPAEDAVIIDTTNLRIEEVLEKVLRLVQERMRKV